MRKFNMFLTIGIMLLVILHGLEGAFSLFGANRVPSRVIAYTAMALVGVHIVIGTILTVQTLLVWKKNGVGYFKANLGFWTRRISGFVVLIPLVMHLTIFSNPSDDLVRLREFTLGRMISQILLLVTLGLHIFCNVRPALLSVGIKGKKMVLADILFALSVLLLVFAIAFFVYYMRWMAL